MAWCHGQDGRTCPGSAEVRAFPLYFRFITFIDYDYNSVCNVENILERLRYEALYTAKRAMRRSTFDDLYNTVVNTSSPLIFK